MPASAKTVVEVLYPEYANQAGDNGNAMYLRACLPEAEVVETTHDDVPYFADHTPSLILLCGMSEAQQEKTIELLSPYRDRLAALVDAGCPMLFTGNAPEVLGTKIVNPDGSEVAGLGILDFVTSRNMPERYHDVVIGDFVPAPGEKPIKVVGFKIQFTQMESGHTAGEKYVTVPTSDENQVGGVARRCPSVTTKLASASTSRPRRRASARTTSWPRGSSARYSRSTRTSRATS